EPGRGAAQRRDPVHVVCAGQPANRDCHPLLGGVLHRRQGHGALHGVADGGPHGEREGVPAVGPGLRLVQRDRAAREQSGPLRPLTRPPARGSRFRRDPDAGHHPAGTLPVMQTLVVDHPLVTHKLTILRDETPEAPTSRRLPDELVTLLAYEATREVPVRPVTVRTPVADAGGVKMARPEPLVVPVLRAGIGMLDGMARLLPTADVGFVGLARDEESLVASTYANRLPARLSR